MSRFPVDQTGVAMFQPLRLLVGAKRFRVITRPITKQHLRKTLVNKAPALCAKFLWIGIVNRVHQRLVTVIEEPAGIDHQVRIGNRLELALLE